MKHLRISKRIVLGLFFINASSCTPQGTAPSAQEFTTNSAAHGSEESPEVDAQEIRSARELQFLDFQLHINPHDNCKYESSISTPPPFKKVALTFDDGPRAGQTPYILETLAKYHIHATFFMIGRSAKALPALVNDVAAQGHLIIGNHSWTHPNFHDLSAQAQAEEVLKNEQLLGQHFGPKLFRYPYGNSSCATNALLHSRGYKIVGWHVDSCDWGFNKTGTVSEKDAKICEVAERNRSNFVNHVLSSVRESQGGIVLLHEIQPHTIRQLETIIRGLISEGYSFGTLDEADFQPSLR